MKQVNFSTLYHQMLGLLREQVEGHEILRTMERQVTNSSITVTPDSLSITVESNGVESTHTWKTLAPAAAAQSAPQPSAMSAAFERESARRASSQPPHRAYATGGYGGYGGYQGYGHLGEGYPGSVYGRREPPVFLASAQSPGTFQPVMRDAIFHRGGYTTYPGSGVDSNPADARLVENLQRYGQQVGLDPKMVEAALRCVFIGFQPQLTWLKTARLQSISATVAPGSVHPLQLYYQRMLEIDSRVAVPFQTWMQEANGLMLPVFMERAQSVAYVCLSLALGLLPGMGAPNDKRWTHKDWMSGDQRLQEREQWSEALAFIANYAPQPAAGETTQSSGAVRRPEDKHSEHIQRLTERVVDNLKGEAYGLTLRLLTEADTPTLELLSFVNSLDHPRRKTRIKAVGIAQALLGFAVLHARGVPAELTQFLQQWHPDWEQTQAHIWADWNGFLKTGSGQLAGHLQNYFDTERTNMPEEAKRAVLLLLWSMGEGFLPGQVDGWREHNPELQPYVQAARQLWAKVLATESTPAAS